MTTEEITKVNQLQREGYGYKKIASFTGLSINTVKAYCRRHPISKEDTIPYMKIVKPCWRIADSYSRRFPTALKSILKFQNCGKK